MPVTNNRAPSCIHTGHAAHADNSKQMSLLEFVAALVRAAHVKYAHAALAHRVAQLLEDCVMGAPSHGRQSYEVPISTACAQRYT